MHLEDQRRTLSLLVTAKFEVFASLERELGLGLAHVAFQPQHDLLGSFRTLVEHGLCLTSITRLLAVISPLSLREQRGLSRLVLCDLVDGVLVAILALAVGSAGLGNVHHLDRLSSS